MDIKSIFESLGYKLSNHGNYFKTSRVWCGGDNPGAVTIYPKSNRIIDHVDGKIYNLESFLKLVLQKDDKQFQEWLDNNNYKLPRVDLNSNIKLINLIEFEEKDLLPVYDYWINRGIPEETLKKFDCGLSKNGIMKDRFTFLVKNGKKEIIGVVGRDITNKKKAKWKICGAKAEFVYNALLNHSNINNNGEVILIESIGDGISLSSVGINNWLCLFGTELQLGILNYLIKINPKKIIISTNNDKLTGGQAGNSAAEKIYKKLCKYFDSSILEIKLPQSANDWNETLVKFEKNQIIKEFSRKV